MARSGSITFHTSELDSSAYSRIIGKMLDFGWSFDDYGKMSFMVEDFDWHEVELSSSNEVMKKVFDNIDNNSPSGVTLTWGRINIGGSFLFINSQTLLFSLIVNTVYLPNSSLVDFSWYLEKLVPVLDVIIVEKVVCTHEN